MLLHGFDVSIKSQPTISKRKQDIWLYVVYIHSIIKVLRFKVIPLKGGLTSLFF